MLKLTKYHLYIFLTLLFIACLAGLNLKYDRYYRLSGLTNENRILIEENLTEEEKKYLIENCIPVNFFINYINEPHFKLMNYEYYRQVPGEGGFDSLDEMVCIVNEIVEDLEEDPNIEEIFQKMIQGNLLHAYANEQEVFNYDYIDLYSATNQFNAVDENLVSEVNTIVKELEDCGYSEEDVHALLPQLVEGYSIDMISELLVYKNSHPDFEFVVKPGSKVTVLKEGDYLGNYEPNDLERCEKLGLMFYETYLRKDAQVHYKEMYEAFNEADIGEELLIVSAYKSHEVLLSENSSVDEAQLGFTVHVKANGFYDNAFGETKTKAWLDEHSWEYGWILRYPEDTKDHEAESYTYRYVGKKIAQEMHDENLTLEQYNEKHLADH